MKVLTITNQKGGVAKSTTANALGAGLCNRGKRVLYVDLDGQSNLTYSILGNARIDITPLDVLTGTANIKQAILHSKQGDILPASPSLFGAEMRLQNTGKEYRLKEALMDVAADYDFVIIDNPPALGVLTVNALTAADYVLIPAQADAYSLQGIGQLSETIKAVKQYCNPSLKVLGVVITRYNGRAILSKDMAKMLGDSANYIGAKLYDTKIRECIALKEAQALKQDIFSYSGKSNGAVDYNSLIEELLEQIERG